VGRTNISWTNETWNPVTGCSHVSEGCRFCYAETLSLRHGWSTKPWTARNAAENVRLHPDRLDDPLHWRKPRMVFVNSMSDLFHELVPLDFLARIWDVMVRTPQHTYQILTKRPERMRTMLGPSGIGFYAVDGPVPRPQPNIWLGISAEDQGMAASRLAELVQTPAAVHFVSCEPLLGDIDVTPWLWNLQWLICGGESGHGHRPMDVAWLISLVEQCRDAGVPYFVKQDSGRLPGRQGRIPDAYWIHEWPEGVKA